MKILVIGPAAIASLGDLEPSSYEKIAGVTSFVAPNIENKQSTIAFRAWAQQEGAAALDKLFGPWDPVIGPDVVLVAFSAGGAGIDELLPFFAPAYGRIRGVVLADALFLSYPASIEQRAGTVAFGEFCKVTAGRFLVATSSSNGGPNHTTGSFALQALMGALSAEGSAPPPWPLIEPAMTYRAPGAEVWGLDYQQLVGDTPKANHINHINYCAARVLAGLNQALLRPNAPQYPPKGGNPPPNVPGPSKPKIPLPNVPPKNGKYSWETRADGSLWVNTGTGNKIPLQIEPPDPVRWERTVRWTGLVRQVLTQNKISLPLHWVMGVIYVESGGDPDAIGKSNGERGLMQVIPNGSAADTFGFNNPEYGILRGCNILAQYHHLDLPAAVSCYNGGPRPNTTPYQPRTSAASPWGYKEHPGHIERVVRAANSFLFALGPTKRRAAGAGGLLLLGVVGAALYAAGRR